MVCDLMENFKPDEKETEKQSRKILLEIFETNSEIKNDKNKKILIIVSIIFLFIIFIKLFLGTLDIPNIFGYPQNKVRFYKVSMNGETISTEYFLTQKIPVIPYLINLKSKTFGQNYVLTDEDGTYFVAKELDKLIIDIESYSCYYDKYQVGCKDSSDNMKKNNDTKYTRLIINRNSKPFKEVYNGKFINDITTYIKDKGVYGISITAEYAFVETEITFSIRKK